MRSLLKHQNNRSESVPMPYQAVSSSRRNIARIEQLLSKAPILETQDINEGMPSPTESIEFRKRSQNIDSINSIDNLQKKSNVLISQENQFVEKKMKVLEDNARYFEQQAHPLFIENNQLKDELIAIQELLRTRTRQLGDIILKENTRNESREIVKKIGDLEQLLVCVKEDYEDFGGNVGELKRELEYLKLKYAEEKKLKEKIISDLQKQLKESIEERDIKINNLIVEIQNTKSQNEILKIEIEAEKASKQEEIKKRDDQIQTLKIEVKQQREKAKIIEIEHDIQLKKVDAMISTLKEKFVKEKKEIYDQMESEIKKLKSQHFKETEAIKLKMEEQKNNLEKIISEREKDILTLKEELETLKDETSKKINNLESVIIQLEDSKQQLEISLSSTKRELSKIQKIAKQLEQNVNQLTDENDSLKMKVQELEQEYSTFVQRKAMEIRQLQSKISQLEDILQEKEQTFKQKLKQQQIRNAQELEDQLEKLRKEGESKIMVVQKEYEDMIRLLNQEKGDQMLILQKKIREQLEEMSQLRLKLENTIKEQKESISSLKDLLQNERDQRAKETKELLEQADNLKKEKERCLREEIERRERDVEKINSDMKRTVDEMKAKAQLREEEWEEKVKQIIQEWQERLRRELWELKDQNQNDMNRLREFYENQIAALREDSKVNSKSVIEDMARRHQQEIDRMKEEFLERERELKEEFDKKLQKVTQDFQRKIDNYLSQIDMNQKKIKELENKIAQMKEIHLEEIRKKQEIIDQLNNKIRQLEEKIKENQDEFNKLSTRIKNLEEELEEIKRLNSESLLSLKDQKDKLESIFKKREDKLREEFERQLNILLLEQAEFIEKMKIQYKEMIQKQQIIDSQVADQIEDLENKFVERPSRAEDIRQIQLLIKNIERQQKMVDDAEAKALRANEMVKYYQLEIQNHKNVYDIFGPTKQKIDGDSDQANSSNLNASLVLPKQKLSPIQHPQSIQPQLTSNQISLSPIQFQNQQPLKGMIQANQNNRQSLNLEAINNQKTKQSLNNESSIVNAPTIGNNNTNKTYISNSNNSSNINNININSYYPLSDLTEYQNSEQSNYKETAKNKKKKLRGESLNQKVSSLIIPNELNSSNQLSSDQIQLPDLYPLKSFSYQQPQQSQSPQLQQQQQRKGELRKLGSTDLDNINEISNNEKSKAKNYRSNYKVSNVRDDGRISQKRSQAEPLSLMIENSNKMNEEELERQKEGSLMQFSKDIQNIKQVSSSYGSVSNKEESKSAMERVNSFQHNNQANTHNSYTEKDSPISKIGFSGPWTNRAPSQGEGMLSSYIANSVNRKLSRDRQNSAGRKNIAQQQPQNN